MTKRLWIMLLVLCMTICLFAGCAKSETPAQEQKQSEQQTVPQVSEETVQEPEHSEESGEKSEQTETTPAQEVESETEAQTEVSATDSETTDPEKTGEIVIAQPEKTISYPIGDGTNEITMWYVFDQNAFGQYYSSVSEFPSMSYMTEKTGVTLKIDEVSNMVSSEQYQLMIAAGDWDDLIPTNLYSGGAAQAYADDVVIDLTDYLPDNAPNWWAQLQRYTPSEQYAGTTDGLWLSMPSFTMSVISDSGYFTRADWLSELNMDAPDNQTDFMAMIYAMKDAYDPDYPLAVGPGCNFDWANSWFDVAIYAVQGSAVAPYMKDGEIASGLNQDNYRNYLQWLAGLYQDGIINNEFYVSEMGRSESMNAIGTGNSAYWTGMADHMDEFYQYAEDPDFAIATLPFQLNDQGFVYKTPTAKVGSSGGGGGGNAPSVSASCDQVAFVVQWLNWFFTEEGYQFANYGIPGECWNYDDEGNVVYTDLILNNPDGLNSQMAFTTLGWSLSSSFAIGTRYLDTYDENVRSAIEMWSDTTNVRYDQTIPSGAGLDADESSSIINQVSDICAYADEVILRWVIGDSELTDAAWDEYCQRLDSLGLAEVISVYQKAYDDYCTEFGE